MVNLMFITVRPAYGADYNSQKDVLAAWNAGEDFVIVDLARAGQMINKIDAENPALPPIDAINVRFAKDRKVAVVKVKR